MDCIVCNEAMEYYFSKNLVDFDLGSVEYYKCKSCRFCASKTHYEMAEKQWEKLNYQFYKIHNDDNSHFNSNKRWLNQALMLYLMEKPGIIKKTMA